MMAKSRFSYREIASDVSISPDWFEIVPDRPLKARKQLQYIMLFIDEYREEEIATLRKHDRKKILFPDGTLATPEGEIEDEFGARYRLLRCGRISSAVYLEWPEEEGRWLSLPKDRVYPRIRIKSDRPFKCSKIVWHCYTMK